MQAKVNLFDAEYLNQVNTKRLDDLKRIDSKKQRAVSVVNDYLDRESKAS